MENFINDFYEEFFDDFINTPLTSFARTRSNPDITNALMINQQVVDNILNIRRNIQREGVSFPESRMNNFYNSFFGNNFNNENFYDNHREQIPIFNSIFDAVYEMYNDANIEDLQDVKVSLDENQFSKFTNIILDDKNIADYQDNSCNICLSNYDINDNLIKLPCNHYFHKDCISNWLCKENVNCPICRKDCRENPI